MAENNYDGRIVIATDIDTSGIKNGSKNIDREMNNAVSNIKQHFNQLNNEVNKTTQQIEQNSQRSKGTLLKNLGNSISSIKNKIKVFKDDLREAFSPAQSDVDVEKLSAKLSKFTELAEAYDKQIKRLKTQQDMMSGLGETSSKKWDNLDNKLTQLAYASENAWHKVSQIRNELDSIPQRTTRTTRSLEGIKNAFRMLGNVAKRAGLNIVKHFSSHNALHKLNFKTLLRYGLGIRSTYALINKIRNAIKQGMNNLAQFNNGVNPVNTSLSNLKSSLTTLKNSFATAFAPILTTVEPILTSFINKMSGAITYVGMFLARLTGQSTFIKAKKVQEDYAKSLDKTASSAGKASKSLASFDKLDVWNKGTSSGSSSGGTNPNDMFETVALDEGSDFVKELKRQIDEGDWEGVGKLFGEKLNNLVETLDIPSIGTKFAEYLNKVVDFAVGLLTTFNFSALGDNLAEMVNNFFTTFHFEDLAYGISKFISGLFDMMASFIKNLDVSAIGEAIGAFIANIDYIEIATSIVDFLWSAIKSIPSLISGLFKGLFSGWRDVFSSPEAVEVKSEAEKYGEELAEKTNNAYASAMAETKNTKRVANAWFELSMKDFSTLTESQKVLLKQYAQEVAEQLPEVKDYIDEVTGAYRGTKEELQKLLDKQKEQLKFEATKNILKSLYEEEANKILELSDKWSELGKTLTSTDNDVFNNIFGQIDWNKQFTSVEEYRKAISDLVTLKQLFIQQQVWNGDKEGETWSALSAEVQKYANQLDVEAQKWDVLNERIDITEQNLNTMTQAMAENVETIINDAGEVVKAGQDEIVEYTKTCMNEAEKIVKKSNDLIIASIESAQKIMDEFRKQFEEDTKTVNTFQKAMLEIKSGNRTSSGGVGNMVTNNNPFAPQGVPALASGAVLPANKPFLALLGDQKSGNNLEAPEGLIRKIVREEVGRSGSGTLTPNITINASGDMAEFIRNIRFELKQEDNRVGNSFVQMGVTG